MPLVVAWDFDDVCIDFVGAWLRAVRKELHLYIERADIKLDGWDMSAWANQTLYDAGVKINPGPMAWLDWMPLTYWLTADTTPGVERCMSRFADEGMVNEVVTNKPPYARTVVWSWLLRTDVPVTRVEINGHFKKHEVSQAQVLIDDRPSTIRAWNESRGDRLGILYGRSQNIHDREGLVVANSMTDVYELVNHFGQDDWYGEYAVMYR